MRPDVKLGIVISLVVVFIAGGYYYYRDSRGPAIPVANESPATSRQTDEPARVSIADARRKPSGSLPKTTANRPHTGRPTASQQARQEAQKVSMPPNTPSRRAASGKPSRQADRRTQPVPVAPQNTGSTSARGPSPPRVMPVTREVESAPQGALPRDEGQLPSVKSGMEADGSGERGAQAAPARLDPPAPRRATADRSGRQARKETNVPTSRSRPLPRDSSASASALETRPAATGRLEARRATGSVETHRVQPGDTFASLARDYYGHEKFTQFLVDQNPQIPDPQRLRIGVNIRIPPRPPTEAGRPDTPSSAAATVSTRTAPPRPRTYTVKPGDSFYGIARAILGDASRWEELLALNKHLVHGDPRRLQVGDVLSLPD